LVLALEASIDRAAFSRYPVSAAALGLRRLALYRRTLGWLGECPHVTNLFA